MLRNFLSATLVVLTLAGCGIGNMPASVTSTRANAMTSAQSWEPGLDDALALARGTLKRYEELRKEMTTYSGSNETQQAVQAMQSEIDFLTDRLEILASVSTKYPNSLILATISKTAKRTLAAIEPTVQDVRALAPLNDANAFYQKLRHIDYVLYPLVSRGLKDIASAQDSI